MSWRMAAYRAVRPLLFASDPEAIHHLTLRLLGSTAGRWLAPIASGAPPPEGAPIELMGLRFRNRIGLGAGFDKDGLAIRGWAALGFGFVELGTVTPRPQGGNPRPRLFRLSSDEALINRMGSTTRGPMHWHAGSPTHGVNLGRNRDTPDKDAAADYAAAARAVSGVADYVAINVSSPNTPGLRDLQDPARLIPLLAGVADAAAERPILVKLSPDLVSERRDALVHALLDPPVRGLILSNTTTKRDGLRSPAAGEPGGVSGRPLRTLTVDAVAAARATVGDALTIIGSGGIASGADAHALFDSGADLVQLWTGMIYAGPGLIGEAMV